MVDAATTSLPRTASSVGSRVGRAGLLKCRRSTSLFLATGCTSFVTWISICNRFSAVMGDATIGCCSSTSAGILRHTNPTGHMLCLSERLFRTSAIVPLPFPTTGTPLRTGS